MPEVTIDNDPYTYRLQIKSKGTILIEGLELQGEVQKLDLIEGAEIPPAQMADIVRRICWYADDKTFDATDGELYAAGLKVLFAVGERVEQLGNSQGRSQTSRPAMASSRAA